MSEYDTQILIDELQKLIVDKQLTINCKDIEIGRLKKRIEELEKQAEANEFYKVN